MECAYYPASLNEELFLPQYLRMFMWNAYWETVLVSPLDQLIIAAGVLLLASHLFGLWMRFHGTRRLFVQGIDRYRSFLLLLTEILPVLGLLGTVLGLMNTFKSFETQAVGAGDLSVMIRAFAPAMSTTISGLLMIIPNLLFNSLLWLSAPATRESEVTR